MADVHAVIVVDKSGSMGPLQNSTIQGINDFLEKQTQETEGNCYVSLTLFDTSFKVHSVGTKVGDVDRLNHFNYHPGGGTSLYDAVGLAVKGAEGWLDANQWFDGKTVVVVWTDGQDTSCNRGMWHLLKNPDAEDERDVNNLIQYKQGEGWEFLMMGAGGSGWLEASNFTSIPVANVHHVATTDWAAAGTYSGLSSATSTLRSMTTNKVSASAFADSYNNTAEIKNISETKSG